MSSASTTRGVPALLLVAVGVSLACGLVSSAPVGPAPFDATKAALAIKGTAMALQLTQAALAGGVQQPGVPGTQNPQAPSAPNQPQPVGTAAAPPIIVLQPGAMEIAYGEKLGGYPRKSEGIMWGFKGTQGDIVTIILESSNARPGERLCMGLTASTTFTLQIPNGQIQPTYESPHISSMRDYVLPTSGAYYVVASCSGSGCNGHCTEADLSLEKK